MCRSIKPLFNYSPPATDKEIFEASLQFVRKVSGFKNPSKRNEEAFFTATQEIAESVKKLLASLETNSSPRNREEEAKRAREKRMKRYGSE